MRAKPLVAILDYGIGNLRSAQKGFEQVGANARLTADRGLIDDADAVVLPGVGAFAACMAALGRTGLDEAACDAAGSGRPFLGICVGMQVLCSGSDEAPSTSGLGVFNRRVRWIPATVKRPQMQWNILRRRSDHPMFAGLDDPIWVYFVHSLAPELLADDDGEEAERANQAEHVGGAGRDDETAGRGDGETVIATCDYGGAVVAAVARGNIWTAQFHPEKSSRIGLHILSNFVAAADRRAG